MDSSALAELLLTGLLLTAVIAFPLAVYFGMREIRRTKQGMQTPISELSDDLSKASAKHPTLSTVLIFVIMISFAFFRVFGRRGFSALNPSNDPISRLQFLSASIAILFVGAGAILTSVSLTRNQSEFSMRIWNFIQGRGRIWIMPALFGVAALSIIVYVLVQYYIIPHA